jgi:large conductance mechanosensitive channel
MAAEPRASDKLAGQARAGLSGMSKVFAGFKEFISRGNAVELAVGVVVGAAFTSVVGALQEAFISPLIGWVFGQPNLTELWNIGPYTWRDAPEGTISPIKVGAILNALLTFLITAAAIYFFVVLPLNALARRRARPAEEEIAEEIAEEVALLREIRDLLAAGATAAAVASTVGGDSASDEDPAEPPSGMPPSGMPQG